MSKVTAPLLSFGAAGQIAKSMVMANWRGIPYARRYVIPGNPRSTEQTKTRVSFAFLSNVYKIAPADFRLAWARACVGKPYTERNLWTQKNLPVIRGMTDLNGLIMSPGAFGGLPCDITVTPGATQLTVAGTAPSPLPSGWSIKRFIAAAIRDQDPNIGTMYEITAGEDLTTPYSVVLTGLASGQDYQVAGWFEFQRSALTTDLAYGPATAEVGTPT